MAKSVFWKLKSRIQFIEWTWSDETFVSFGHLCFLPFLPVWPDSFYRFHFMSIYYHKKLPNWIQNLPKSVTVFGQILNKPSYNCQRDFSLCRSGKILPNLVTLFPSFFLCLVSFFVDSLSLSFATTVSFHSRVCV